MRTPSPTLPATLNRFVRTCGHDVNAARAAIFPMVAHNTALLTALRAPAVAWEQQVMNDINTLVSNASGRHELPKGYHERRTSLHAERRAVVTVITAIDAITEALKPRQVEPVKAVMTPAPAPVIKAPVFKIKAKTIKKTVAIPRCEITLKGFEALKEYRDNSESARMLAEIAVMDAQLAL